MKAEALKEQTTASRPIKALTVYPPNIPTMLFHKVLQIKSQVKINIFTLIQLFLEFDKTCKKRITPTGLTEGERANYDNLIAELSNLCDKIHNDNHNELVNRFSNLEEHLEYAIGTCPHDYHQRDKKHAPVPLIRTKQVTFEEQCDTLNSNTHKHVVKLNTQKTNVPVPPFTGVNRCTDASGSQPGSNTKKNMILPAKGVDPFNFLSF
nr:hypothetical protein [Tanacetum cinerariifolium]